LELAVQAKAYTDSGYRSAPLFIEGMRDSLKTESAKKILARLQKVILKTGGWQFPRSPRWPKKSSKPKKIKIGFDNGKILRFCRGHNYYAKRL